MKAMKDLLANRYQVEHVPDYFASVSVWFEIDAMFALQQHVANGAQAFTQFIRSSHRAPYGLYSWFNEAFPRDIHDKLDDLTLRHMDELTLIDRIIQRLADLKFFYQVDPTFGLPRKAKDRALRQVQCDDMLTRINLVQNNLGARAKLLRAGKTVVQLQQRLNDLQDFHRSAPGESLGEPGLIAAISSPELTEEHFYHRIKHITDIIYNHNPSSEFKSINIKRVIEVDDDLNRCEPNSIFVFSLA